MSEKETPLVIHAEANGRETKVNINGSGDANDLMNAYTAITESVMTCFEKYDSNSLTEKQRRILITYCIEMAFYKRNKEAIEQEGVAQ